MPTRTGGPPPPAYPHADHPLTDAEVRERFGPLLERFFAAVRDDPQFVADMGVAILRACAKRDRADARAENGAG